MSLSGIDASRSIIRAEMLRGHRGRLESLHWSNWMNATAALTERWRTELGDYPLSYNETASVSHLCSAATHIGLLALAEFSVTEKRSADRRFAADGRCDLYGSDSRRAWAFEFKQLTCRPVTIPMMERSMVAAHACARCLREGEADSRVAALIVSMTWHRDADLAMIRPVMRSFARTCDYAWRIGPDDLIGPESYVYMDLL